MKKKPFVKVLSLALAAITLFVLCACGTAASSPAAEPTASEAPAETEAPAESQGVLDQIKADGVLYVTLSPDFAPMEFVDSSKDGQEQYVGFDVTLAKYIAEYIGVDLVIEPMSFDACQTAVYTGSVPMSISGYSWTEERGASYLPLEPLVIVGVIYFILTFLLSKLFGFFERRMSRADR